LVLENCRMEEKTIGEVLRTETLKSPAVYLEIMI
jgi:hypothetical protein